MAIKLNTVNSKIPMKINVNIIWLDIKTLADKNIKINFINEILNEEDAIKEILNSFLFAVVSKANNLQLPKEVNINELSGCSHEFAVVSLQRMLRS